MSCLADAQKISAPIFLMDRSNVKILPKLVDVIYVFWGPCRIGL